MTPHQMYDHVLFAVPHDIRGGRITSCSHQKQFILITNPRPKAVIKLTHLAEMGVELNSPRIGIQSISVLV